MADLHVAPSRRSLDLSWLRLIFDGWGSRGRCCYSAEFSSRIFGPSVGAGGFFAEVVSIFNLGESCMFPASPDAAREREFVTRPVPSSAADVRHH